MTRLLEIIRENGELYGITDYYIAIKLKPGDKFKYQGHRYRTLSKGNYTTDIPWWEYCWLTRKLADLLIGKRDYDF